MNCSSYNLKIETFENGEIKFSIYSRSIQKKVSSESETESVDSEFSFSPDGIGYLEKNPFTGQVFFKVPNDGEFYDISTPSDKRKSSSFSERAIYSSLIRSKQAIYKYARQVNWEYFITLTFSPEVVDRFDFDSCMKKSRQWFNNQQKRYASDLQYLYVPEMHESGAWHIHGLVARVGSMSFVDSGHRDHGKLIYNLSGWRFGFSTATLIEDTKRVANYVTKYVTKDLVALSKGKSRYYRSRNIPEPQVDEVLIDSLEDISVIADGLGLELKYESSVSGYLDCTYQIYENSKNEESEEK